MYKIIFLSLLLIGCGESPEEQLKRQQQQLQQQQQQLINQQQQQLQQQSQFQQAPAYQPPAVIQQPAAPVVVQQHDSSLTNMLVGGLIGHQIAKMGEDNSSRASDHSYQQPQQTVTHVHNYNTPAPTVSGGSTPVQQVVTPAPSDPVAGARGLTTPPTNKMDMNKLSESAKYSPPSSTSVAPTVASVAKPSGMDMSKLSSPSRPAPAPSPVRSSGMNMSRLSSSGKR
jgi:hypothetical protein